MLVRIVRIRGCLLGLLGALRFFVRSKLRKVPTDIRACLINRR